MPTLEEYYHLLRTQEPILDGEALRASIRVAVERASAEALSLEKGEENTLHKRERLEPEAHQSSGSNAHGDSHRGQVAAETAEQHLQESVIQISSTSLSEGGISGLALLSGGVAPLLTGITVLSAIALVGLFWAMQQSSNIRAILRIPSEQTATNRLTTPATNQTNTSGETPKEDNTEITTKEHEGEERKNNIPSNMESSPSAFSYQMPLYDNTEELNYPSNDHHQVAPQATKYDATKQDVFHDFEMHEMERYKEERYREEHLQEELRKDSLLHAQYKGAAVKKKDAARHHHHRQRDLFLQLVQRAREQVARSAQSQTLRSLPCSLPAALGGQATFDCILIMLEQQSLLVQDITLSQLTQQARLEKTSIALTTLETYIREHY